MAKTPTYTTTIPTTAAGMAGSNYANVTIAGSSGASLTYATGTTNWSTVVTEPYYTKQPKVKISDQDIELDGLSLKETMQAIRDELLIPGRLNRNSALEQEFAELKESAERYYELEKKFLEQKKMWETLKRTDQ